MALLRGVCFLELALEIALSLKVRNCEIAIDVGGSPSVAIEPLKDHVPNGLHPAGNVKTPTISAFICPPDSTVARSGGID